MSERKKWIPVRVGLPERQDYYQVTIKCNESDGGGYKTEILLWCEDDWRTFWRNGAHWMMGTYHQDLNGEVIAWRMSSLPYIPDEEEE